MTSSPQQSSLRSGEKETARRLPSLRSGEGLGVSFLLPPALYMLAAVLITWPIISQLSTYGLGAGYGDQFENVRLIWWAQYALQHGLNPFYQSLLGYPSG